MVAIGGQRSSPAVPDRQRKPPRPGVRGGPCWGRGRGCGETARETVDGEEDLVRRGSRCVGGGAGNHLERRSILSERHLEHRAEGSTARTNRRRERGGARTRRPRHGSSLTCGRRCRTIAPLFRGDHGSSGGGRVRPGRFRTHSVSRGLLAVLVSQGGNRFG